MGNDIGLGLTRSVVYVRQTDLDNNFSNIFSLFQLESIPYLSPGNYQLGLGYYQIQAPFGLDYCKVLVFQGFTIDKTNYTKH